MYQVQNNTVRGLFEPQNKLTNYKLLTNEIHAQEILTPIGKQFVKLRYEQDGVPDAPLSGLVHDEVCEDLNPPQT